MRFVLLLLLCLPSIASAQIQVSEQTLQTWVGFENPTIVNGIVVAGGASKPMLTNVTKTIVIDSQIDFKSYLVVAKRIPTLETVNLEKIDSGYRFKPGTIAGLYNIEVIGYDPEQGLARGDLTINYDPFQPDPVTPVTPDNPDKPLEGLAGDSQAVMTSFIKSMANDMDAIAKEVANGTLKTPLEALTRNNTLDTATRSTFKQSMGVLMKPSLSGTEFPPNASEIFTNIATGFRGSLK